MPPTHFEGGNVNMFQPYVVGQSGTERPEPVLVTRLPASTRSTVQPARNFAKRWSMVGMRRLVDLDPGGLVSGDGSRPPGFIRLTIASGFLLLRESRLLRRVASADAARPRSDRDCCQRSSCG